MNKKKVASRKKQKDVLMIPFDPQKPISLDAQKPRRLGEIVMVVATTGEPHRMSIAESRLLSEDYSKNIRPKIEMINDERREAFQESVHVLLR